MIVLLIEQFSIDFRIILKSSQPPVEQLLRLKIMLVIK